MKSYHHMTMKELFDLTARGHDQFEELANAIGDVHAKIGTILNGSAPKKQQGTGRQPLLNEKQRAEVRSLHKTGEWTHAELANEFGVSTFTISNVVHRLGAYG